MIGPQDLGGRAGFGPVAPDPTDPLFHAEWERTVLGMTLACGSLGHWTLDESRHARECLSPQAYYGSTYYGIWLQALENLLLTHGEITAEELASGTVSAPPLRPERKMLVTAVASVLGTGAPVDRPASAPARFAPGDAVRTTATVSPGHTRLPSYARDKPGTVVAIHGCHVLPDTNAHAQGEQPQWLYAVEFPGHVLWGDTAEPGSSVLIDAWESYLGPI